MGLFSGEWSSSSPIVLFPSSITVEALLELTGSVEEQQIEGEVRRNVLSIATCCCCCCCCCLQSCLHCKVVPLYDHFPCLDEFVVTQNLWHRFSRRATSRSCVSFFAFFARRVPFSPACHDLPRYRVASGTKNSAAGTLCSLTKPWLICPFFCSLFHARP